MSQVEQAVNRLPDCYRDFGHYQDCDGCPWEIECREQTEWDEKMEDSK